VGQFVSQGIQELAELRDHVEFPCHHAVKHIGQRGDAHDQGSHVIIHVRGRGQIQPGKDRNHEQTEISHQVRNG